MCVLLNLFMKDRVDLFVFCLDFRSASHFTSYFFASVGSYSEWHTSDENCFCSENILKQLTVFLHFSLVVELR